MPDGSVFTTVNDKPVVWRDQDGVMHACEGAWLHRGIRLMWTRCGKRDVPAMAAWHPQAGDEVTCPECRAAIARSSGNA